MSSHRVSSLAVLSLIVVLAGCPGDGSNIVAPPAPPPPSGPTIQVSAASRSFSVNAGAGNVAAQTIEVTNAGPGTLSNLTASVSYGPGPGSWLVVQFTSFTAPATVTLTPISWDKSGGTYTATVTISSPGAVNVSQAVTVTLTVAAATGPTIGLGATHVPMSATAGGANPGLVDAPIANVGPGTLSGLAASVTYQAGEQTGWLTASVHSTTAPSLLTVAPTTGTLAAGTYHATVSITSPVATNSPRVVPVTFTVNPPAGNATLVLTPSSQSFSASAGGANPASKTVQVTNGGSGTLSGLSLAVGYQAGQPTGWLSGRLNTTTAPATLTVQVVTGALAAGTYNGKIWVSSTAASNSPRGVDVTFTVTSPTPVIGLTPAAVTFNATAGGANPTQQVVQITNAGGGTLDGLNGTISYQAGQLTGWLTVSLGTTNAPTTLTVRATTGARVAGTYNATVTLTANGATPRALAVTFVVAAAPSIVLNPATARSYTLAPTETSKSENVAVSNGGGGSLTGVAGTVTYQSGQPGGWLQAALSGTTAPATLTLTASRGSLAAGTYNATVSVTSSVADNSPRTLAVTLTVQAAPAGPAISVSVTSRTFSATAGGGNPPSLQAAVGNSGGGSLTGLAVAENPAVSWLAVSLSSTTAPATITFQATTGTLTAGTYTTTVQVTSPVATNSPQSVTVTFNVAPPPSVPTTLRVINDLPGNVAGPNDWGQMNRVVRLRVGPTQSSVVNMTGGAVELLFNGDYTSMVDSTRVIAPGNQATFNVSMMSGEYFLYIQNGWWEYFSESGLWEKHMTGVVGCDGQTTVYKGTIIHITAPFGSPEEIRLSDWLPIGNYYGSPFCP